MYKEKILIVEDESIVAIHLKTLLRHDNYEVLEILSSGEDALQYVKSIRPDLILMDIHLKGNLDGIETAALIKELFEIPIIYLTAYSDQKTITRAKITEPFGYLVKPVDEKELYITVEMALFKAASGRKLKETEERFKALQNSSFYLIYIHDFEGNLIDANQTALSLLDISHFELNTININNFVVPESLSHIYKLMNDLKDKNQQLKILEIEINSRSGEKYFLEVTGSLVYKNSIPYAVQMIGKDITKRKNAQEDLRKSEARYRKLVERLNEGIIQVDNNDIIQFVNNRFCEIVGYSAEEILGRVSYKIFVLEKDWNLVKQKNIERTTHKTDKYKLKFKKKDGLIIWVELSAVPVYNEENNVIGSTALITDITERKIAEKAVSHLAAIVESSEDAIFSKSLDGRIISWNKGAEMMYGYTQSEIIGKHISILAPQDRHEEMDIIMDKLKKGFRIDSFETVRKKKDGTNIFVSLSISPIVDREGKIFSASSIARDITEFKNASNSTKISEAKYKDIFNFAPAGIFQVDQKGKIITVNTTFASILGYESPDDLYQINFTKDIFLEKNQFSNLMKKASKTSSPIDTELQWKRKNNEIIWIQLTIHLVKTNREEFSYYEGFVRDITAHKKSKQILMEQEQSYKSLIDTSIDAIYVLQNRKLLLVNNAWEKLFGYTSDEATSPEFDILKIVAPESKEDIESRFNKLENHSISSPNSSRYEMKGISRQGRSIYLEVSASEIIWKGKPAVQGIYRDISERKDAEEQIKMLSLAIKQSSASIIITDTKGNIEYVNPKFTQLTGYTAEEVLGKSPNILSTSNLNEEKREEIIRTISSGKEWRGEFLNKKKNNELYWESASISPILDDNNKITHYLSVQEDVTLRKRQEQQLIVAKELAEKSDKLKTEFLAQMSHEIRTPLNNILTYTSVLKEEFENKLPVGLESTFQVIDSSSKRLIRTIELILNLSKLHTGNYDTEIETVDLEDDILENIILEFYSKVKQKNIALNYKNEANHYKVMGDQYSLGQVFLNLIDNAIKYTEQGEINILMYNEGNNVCIDVTDTGIGISSEYLNDLFNPFSQEDSGMTRHFEGIGLGLALVKKYVEINNADIKVTSEKGRGSTFTFSMDYIRE